MLQLQLSAMRTEVVRAAALSLLFTMANVECSRPVFPGATLASHDLPSEKLNLRPLIGVVSQGGEPAPEGYSYIAASYVKFIEAAGARAVPILHDMSREEVRLLSHCRCC